MRNLKIKVLSISILPLLASSLFFSVSFKNKQEIRADITLFADSTYIMPGSSLQIRTTDGKMSNYSWSVQAPTNKVYINNEGVLIVSGDLTINESFIVTVTATNKAGEKGSIDINVVPYVSPEENNFLGFEGNCVHYFDRFHNQQSAPIIQTSPYQYEVSKPIDIFCEDQLSSDPEGHWITFRHLVRRFSNDDMSWHLNTFTSPKKTLVWNNYEDGEPTNKCPGFQTIHVAHLSDFIEVTFKCNELLYEKGVPDVKLKINLNVWMNQQVITNAAFVYNPQEGDPHYIRPSLLAGEYISQLYCPASGDGYIYTDCMQPIYCYNPLHEYTEYSFSLDTTGIDPKIKNAFSYDIQWERITRQSDNYPIYKITFWYSFDMNKMPSAKEMGYVDYDIGQFIADDAIAPNNAWIRFHLVWKE